MDESRFIMPRNKEEPYEDQAQEKMQELLGTAAEVGAEKAIDFGEQFEEIVPDRLGSDEAADAEDSARMEQIRSRINEIPDSSDYPENPDEGEDDDEEEDEIRPDALG